MFGTSHEPILSLSHITIRYPTPDGRSEIVVEDVSLEVAPGELVCVAGRSGSGKTSLLNVAAGLMSPSVGHVRWENLEIEALVDGTLAHHRRRLLGYVFQGGGLIESLTAAENAVLAALPDGLEHGAEDRVARLFADLGLGDRRDHFPAQLSGGEVQRAALARALFNDPPALIVDEPTANLDRSTADDVIATLTSLAKQGRALLVASHDLHLLAIATRVCHLEKDA